MDRDINKIPDMKKQTRHLKVGRVILLLMVIILVVAGVMYGFLGGNSPINTLANTFLLKEKINILVLGVDARDDDVGRSDTAFLVTIDTIAKNITMLSIPRDSRVKINGHGWDKMNHAYAFGGSKLSKSVVENLLAIPVDYTVVMNFQGFVHMIDALGGVTIDVEKRMHYSDPYDDDGGLYIDLRPGVQRLTGKTAIEYVRYRDEEGDIGRVARQQKFLKALLQELSKPQVITKLPELIKEFSVAVRTDMPTKEMIKLIPVINDGVKAGLHTEWLSGTPCWIQDISYWLVDMRELRYKVAQIQGIVIDEGYEKTTDKLVLEYAKSLPRETKVDESSPPVKKNSNVSKAMIDSTKTTVTPSGTTTAALSNKLQVTTPPGNGQVYPDSPNTKNIHSPNTEVTGDSNGIIHKNTTMVEKNSIGENIIRKK